MTVPIQHRDRPAKIHRCQRLLIVVVLFGDAAFVQVLLQSVLTVRVPVR